MTQFHYKKIEPPLGDRIVATRYEVRFDDVTTDGYTFIGRVYSSRSSGMWHTEGHMNICELRHEAVLADLDDDEWTTPHWTTCCAGCGEPSHHPLSQCKRPTAERTRIRWP